MTTIGANHRKMDFTFAQRLEQLMKERKVSVNLIALGRGTAQGEVQDMFGMENVEKAVCFSLVTGETWKQLKKDLRSKLKIDVPGTGIAFKMPLSSIGGKRELMFLTDGQGFERGEEESMKNTERELLLVISNEGYNELVMDAAKSAGAACSNSQTCSCLRLRKAPEYPAMITWSHTGIPRIFPHSIILFVISTSGTDTVGRNISPPQRSSKPTAAIYSDTLTMRAARTVRALTVSSRSELWAALPW